MKIGLIAPFFLPEIGGANIYCYELAIALAHRGHEVHIFSRPGALGDPRYVLHPVLTLDLASDLALLRRETMDVWHSLFFFHAALALTMKNMFVTGHGDDFFSLRVRRKLPAKAWLQNQIVWRLPDSARASVEDLITKAERGLTWTLTWLGALRARRLVAVSTFSCSRAAAFYPLTRRRFDVIPPGVSERFFQNPGNGRNRMNLLTVTRLDEQDRIKNVHSVVAALAELQDRYDFRYRIIGGAVRGSYRHELEQMVADLGLGAKVTIEGRKADDELTTCYGQAGLFILCSYAQKHNFEGFGIVFLEANASGVPVLTTRDGGMRDYVIEGVNGFFAEDGSPQAIRLALERYFDGEVVFDSARVKEAPERYRWPRIAERIESMYLENKR